SIRIRHIPLINNAVVIRIKWIVCFSLILAINHTVAIRIGHIGIINLTVMVRIKRIIRLGLILMIDDTVTVPIRHISTSNLMVVIGVERIKGFVSRVYPYRRIYWGVGRS